MTKSRSVVASGWGKEKRGGKERLPEAQGNLGEGTMNMFIILIMGAYVETSNCTHKYVLILYVKYASIKLFLKERIRGRGEGKPFFPVFSLSLYPSNTELTATEKGRPCFLPPQASHFSLKNSLMEDKPGCVSKYRQRILHPSQGNP